MDIELGHELVLDEFEMLADVPGVNELVVLDGTLLDVWRELLEDHLEGESLIQLFAQLAGHQ